MCPPYVGGYHRPRYIHWLPRRFCYRRDRALPCCNPLSENCSRKSRDPERRPGWKVSHIGIEVANPHRHVLAEPTTPSRSNQSRPCCPDPRSPYRPPRPDPDQSSPRVIVSACTVHVDLVIVSLGIGTHPPRWRPTWPSPIGGCGYGLQSPSGRCR